MVVVDAPDVAAVAPIVRVTKMSVPTDFSGASAVALRVVESRRDADDADDEADAEGEAESGEERAAGAPAQLAPDVGELEHPSNENTQF